MNRARSARGGRPSQSGSSNSRPQPGLAARELAVDLIAAVLSDRRGFDEALAGFIGQPAYRDLEPRDLGMARSIAANALRFARPLQEVVSKFIEKPLPVKQGRVSAILLSAAAQMFILKTPAHAAISLAVDQARGSRQSAHMAKFVNAVLRKVAAAETTEFARPPDLAHASIPPWLFQRWVGAYGEESAAAIAQASLREAPLDLTLKQPDSAAAWAESLGAEQLATGSLRLTEAGRVDQLPGFKDGAWWVQDAAAALPARLLGDVRGLEVADLCAAPGGKTAQLAAAGAAVVAVDQSSARLVRVRDNLARLQLSAEIVEADVATWAPQRTFDAVLLDAPCTATGTIRRHPDILHLKRESDIAELAALQRSMLENAAKLVRPGGLLVYCTCSLQPEEGEEQAERFLAETTDWVSEPASPAVAAIPEEWLTEKGFLRTLPSMTPAAAAKPGEAAFGGIDGFFAARFRRRGG
ncbi:MAG: methyltransferase domain-containing protein [Alphaproteobacteria bacterium]|nr:methyltransferase domain-containing protein [Alphaproteobacteria bacterium]